MELFFDLNEIQKKIRFWVVGDFVILKSEKSAALGCFRILIQEQSFLELFADLNEI